MIRINWDFVSGKEVSFIEGRAHLSRGDEFQTNVLNFFCWDYLINHNGELPFTLKSNDIQDIIVLKSNGEFISLRHLDKHTDKEMRWVHNTSRMLVANGFQWLPNFDENYDWDFVQTPIWEGWK